VAIITAMKPAKKLEVCSVIARVGSRSAAREYPLSARRRT